MRRITYGGGVFLTGDQVATALLSYAQTLSETNASDTVMVPGMTTGSVEGEIEVLIGPASQLMSEPAPGSAQMDDDQLLDKRFVDEMRKRGSRKRRDRASSLDPTLGGPGSFTWIDDI